MKWVALILVVLCCTSCIYASNKLVEYREVYAAPTVDPIIKDNEEPGPLDVSNTTVTTF